MRRLARDHLVVRLNDLPEDTPAGTVLATLASEG